MILHHAIKVILFDLDCTLYADSVYYTRFVSHLLKDTPYQSHEAKIQQKVKAIMSGNDLFSLGNFYDRSLTSSSNALDDCLDIIPILDTDYAPATLLHGPYDFIGDGWNVVFMIAHRLGISEPHIQAAFSKVREEMLTPEYAIELNPNLIPLLKTLSYYLDGLYLITNTPYPQAIDFIKYIGLENIFTDIYYDAHKPLGLIDILPDIIDAHQISSSQILSIGDNSFKDLYPVKARGGQTVLITPHPTTTTQQSTLHIHTLSELENLLSEIIFNFQSSIPLVDNL